MHATVHQRTQFVHRCNASARDCKECQKNIVQNSSQPLHLVCQRTRPPERDPRAQTQINSNQSTHVRQRTVVHKRDPRARDGKHDQEYGPEPHGMQRLLRGDLARARFALSAAGHRRARRHPSTPTQILSNKIKINQTH